MIDSIMIRDNRFQKYHSSGHLWYSFTDRFTGYLWEYSQEEEQFAIEIYDFLIEKETRFDLTLFDPQDDDFVIIYLMTANGISESTDNPITSQSVIIGNTSAINGTIRLHDNYPFKAVIFCFDRQRVADLLDYHLVHRPVDHSDYLVTLRLTTKLKSLVGKILDCMPDDQLKNDYFSTIADQTLVTTVKELDAMYESITDPLLDEKEIIAITSYIEQNYNQSLTQQDIVKLTPYSLYQLQSRFKKFYNQTLTEFIQRERINFGDLLLDQSKMSVSDIAKKVGYSSLSNFIIAYKQLKNKLPRLSERGHYR